MQLNNGNLIPLTGGAYQARGYIADNQICENLFPELNPQETDPPVPVTHYPREGKRLLSTPGTSGPGRGIFTMSNGKMYGVAGQTVYYIDQNFVWNVLGKILLNHTPVSIADNGTTAIVVDGTSNGYTIDLASNTFAPLNDPTGTFVGSRKVDFSDTFLGFTAPGTNGWYVTLSDQVAFNALVQANADTTPDPIQNFIFSVRQAWLFKTRNTEIWYLAGSTPFPYQAWPNVFVQHGCAAPYSVVRADTDVFWLSSNAQGRGIALKSEGYGAVAISTRALEFEWSKYPTISDVIGSTFQQGGHTFIIFHFPTADKTWAYDLSTKQWHRRTYLDSNGVAHREKTTFYTSVGASGGYPETIVAQDWQTGQIYALDPTYYTDNGVPILCRRTFPHILKDLHFITHAAFVADFETGEISGYAENATNPAIALSMRYSSDGGNNWSNYRQKQLITSGNYRKMMRWRGLGMARDRVYELSWSYPGPSALQGAYIEPLEHSS